MVAELDLAGVCNFLEYGKKGYTIPNIDNVKFTDPSVTVLQV